MKVRLTSAELKVVRRIASIGGKARARSLTPARRSEIARLGAITKWTRRRLQAEQEQAEQKKTRVS
jgi:hypothetical protein